jgi:selenocysteine lyase/cysteine desulfurase
MAAVYKANAALELLLDVGMPRIGMRTQKLSRELFDRATERGWGVRASTDPKRRSAIVCLDLPGRPEVAPLVQGLSDRGIIIDSRAGALRIAPHFFNTIEEIERALDAIADLMHK